MSFQGQVGQQFYAQEMGIALPGQIIGMGQYMAMPYFNNATAVKAVYTVTPPATPDATTTYSLTFDGTNTVSFTTGASTTTAQLGAGLHAAIVADAEVFRKVTASVNATTGVITLTSVLFNTAIVITSPTNATTTGDLTIATTTQPGTSLEIPFGRFVSRTSADTVDPVYGYSPARLPTATSGHTILGVTLNAFVEKNAIGPNAKALYQFQRTMSVLQDCVAIRGVWVEAVDTNITTADTLYISVAAGNEGKVTRSSSGTIDLSARASFITSSQVSPTGVPMVGVYLRR